MDTFEDLGLAPELVEALAAEGVEVPTAFQASAMPVLRQGNNLIGRAGPGAGVLVAYGAPLLERLEPGVGQPSAVVAAPTTEAALRLAESLARIARVTGHDVAAVGSPWALPERADVLFATAGDLARLVAEARLKLDQVEVFVVDGGAATEGLEGLAGLTRVMEGLPAAAQRVLITLPVTEGLEELADRTMRRAVTVPPGPAEGGEDEASPVRRGRLRYLVTPEDAEDPLIGEVARILESGEARHVLLFARSEDRAADVGDLLSLHGYLAGAPGEEGMPVWLAVDAAEGREAASGAADEGEVAVVSLDVPPDTDTLDRRHGGGAGGTVLVRSREIPHLRWTARAAGYDLVPAPAPVPTRVADERERLTRRVEQALRDADLAPHYLMLESLLDRWSPGEIAAAAFSLLSAGGGGAAGAGAPEGAGGGATPGSAVGPPPGPPRQPAPTWTLLFVSVGERDGAGPGDILGAVTGEAGLDGSRVGKIEIRESYTLVEVEEAVAPRVIKAVNGTTIRGRAVRVDYDRGRPGGGDGGGRGGGGGGRSGGGRSGGGGGRSGGSRPGGGGGGPRGGGGGRSGGGRGPRGA